jgi:hypothetical protein
MFSKLESIVELRLLTFYGNSLTGTELCNLKVKAYTCCKKTARDKDWMGKSDQVSSLLCRRSVKLV